MKKFLANLGFFLALSLAAPTYASTVKTVFIDSGSTYTIPSDYGTMVSINCFGASGGSDSAVGAGGGGAFSTRASSFNTYTPGQSIVIHIGASQGGGQDGTDTWFDGANLAASTCGAQSGRGSVNGGTGGAASAGIGTTKYSGGNGEVGTPAGGGGAAGPNGNGNNGSAGAGGSGDAGFGGAGGALGSIGSSGAEYTSNVSPNVGTTAGAGGGGGSSLAGAGTSGGFYGGGPGGGISGTAGAKQGSIVFVYNTADPVASSNFRSLLGVGR